MRFVLASFLVAILAHLQPGKVSLRRCYWPGLGSLETHVVELGKAPVLRNILARHTLRDVGGLKTDPSLAVLVICPRVLS